MVCECNTKIGNKWYKAGEEVPEMESPVHVDPAEEVKEQDEPKEEVAEKNEPPKEPKRRGRSKKATVG